MKRLILTITILPMALSGIVSYGMEDDQKRVKVAQEKLNKQLFKAAQENDEAQVKQLLAEKADPNYKDLFGQTALLWAVTNNNLEITTLLLEAGANASMQNDLKISPLHKSTENNNVEITRLLLEYKADPNSKDPKHYTPLHISAHKNFYDITKILLEYESDPNSRNNRGITPLLFAINAGNTQIVELLLKQNADPDQKNNRGNSPLLSASLRGHKESGLEILKLLLKYKANPNIQSAQGKTALYFAAMRGSLDMVIALLSYKADPNIQDVNGKKAFDIAKNDTIKTLLLTHTTPKEIEPITTFLKIAMRKQKQKEFKLSKDMRKLIVDYLIKDLVATKLKKVKEIDDPDLDLTKYPNLDQLIEQGIFKALSKWHQTKPKAK